MAFPRSIRLRMPICVEFDGSYDGFMTHSERPKTAFGFRTRRMPLYTAVRLGAWTVASIA